MTLYNVHLYREMRLTFAGIEAETPEAAAALARDNPTSGADDIEDCNGEELAALVDLAGADDYSQSVTIDFEAERQRKAATALLSALNAILPYAENEAFSLEKLKDSPQAEEEAERAWNAVEAAQAAIAMGKTGLRAVVADGSVPSRFVIEHNPLKDSGRAHVLVDGLFGVAIIRTDEGIVIDIYPQGWIEPIDTMTVWDDQVAATHQDAE